MAVFESFKRYKTLVFGELNEGVEFVEFVFLVVEESLEFGIFLL